MTKSARIMRGLSIATTVFSSFSVVSSLMFLMAVTGFTSVASQDSYLPYLFYQVLVNHGVSYQMAESITVWLMNFGGAVATIIAGVSLFVSAITLAAGIIGIVKSSTPGKANTAMVWAIIGAGFSFASLHIITMVLFIFQAVFSHAAKKETAAQQMSC